MKDIPKHTFSDFIRGEDKEEVMLEVLDKVQREQLRVIENAEPAAAVGALDIAKWSLLDGQIGDS
jgi:hypothetical protein